MSRPRQHAAASLALATLVVLRRRRIADALPVLVAGVLVDLDHLLDLAVARSRGSQDHLILPLHAWEWVLGLAAQGSQAAGGLAMGLALHLALDQRNRPIQHPLFYWLVVRARYGFRAAPPLVDTSLLHETNDWIHQGPLDWL